MFTGGTCALVAAAAALLVSAPRAEAQDAIVTSITPSQGGVGGAVRLTIYGQNFASDLFNFGAGRENLGNLVWLTSATQSYDCDVFKEGCNEEQIQCYTRPMPEGVYTVSVAVNGQMVDSGKTCAANPNNCKYTAAMSSTPVIDSILPITSEPGALITVRGKIFTTRYGSNVATSTNGNTAQILRVYSGGQGCELMDNAGTASATPYGITLDNDGTADTGQMTCQRSGTYIGNHNTSFILSPPYGRSKPSMQAIRAFANGELATLQTYTRLTSVSPNEGSTAGGTSLTITGQYFDATDVPVKVDVNGVPCDVTKFDDSHIFCTTKPQSQSSSSSSFPGGRGLLHELWNDTSVSGPPANVATMSVSSPFYTRSWIDQAAFSYPYSRFATRTSGYVLLPRDTICSLAIVSTGGTASLYFSSVTGRKEDKSLTATSTGNRVASNRYTLRARVPYYVEILHVATSSSNNVRLEMQIYDAPFTASMTGAAVNEAQLVTVSTEVVPETQQVSFELWGQVYGTSSVNEQQTIALPALSGGVYRLSVAGAKTGDLSGTSTSAEITAALNDLPTVYPDVVSVVSTSVASGGQILTVTFQSERGVWPIIEAMLADGRNASVRRTVTGIPSKRSVMLEMDGVRSRPFNPNGTSGEVTAAVLDLFSVKCPRSLTDPSNTSTAFYTNFEQPDGGLYTQGGNWWGTVTESYTPFCGRKSLVNPNYLFRVPAAIPLATYPKLCFAYLGDINSYMGISFSYLDGAMPQTVTEWYYISGLIRIQSWNYICVDLLTLVKQRHPTGSYFQVIYTQVYSTTSLNLFIDVVSLSKKDLAPDYQAAVASRLLTPRGVLVHGVQVTIEKPFVYNIAISPVNCSCRFNLFTVPGSVLYDNSATTDGYNHTEDVSPTPDSIFVDESTSNPNLNDSSEVQITPSGMSVSDTIVNVTRITAASFPIGGTYDLFVLNNTVSGIPGDASEEALTNMMQFAGVGSVKVNRWGSCQQYTWLVEFVMRGGDVPLMTANGSHLEGTSASVLVQPYIDGVLNVSPVLGDMLAVPENTAQVRVSINDIPTRCSGNCEFSWAIASTPSLNSLSPLSGSGSQRLTISGSGFGSDVSGVLVHLGTTLCTVATVSDSQIECNANLSARGNYSVSVNVVNAGNAAGYLTYEHVAQLSAVNPVAGSVAGGTVVTLYGIGFEETMTITVGDAACLMLELTNESLVTCIVQPSANGPDNVDVSVLFTDGSSESLTGGFEFTAASGVAIVSSISTLQASVDGTTAATITGTGFGASIAIANAITLDARHPVEIVSYSDDSIEIVFPRMPPGSYALSILTSAGYADMSTNNIANVEYVLELTDVSPSSVSAFGGAEITITGSGFSSNLTQNVVQLNDRPCTVTEASSTQIKCTLLEAATTYQVDNSGTRPSYGSGYSWQPSSVTCEVGDTVDWSWQAPLGVSGIVYRVEQVTTGGSKTPAAGGFSSGSFSTASGSYTRRFTTAGTYYYWSGPLISASNPLAMWGVVNVVPKPDFLGHITVTVSGYTAIESFATRKRREVVKRSAAACTAEQCSSAGGGAGTVLQTAACAPTVTDIAPTSGTIYDGVRLSGSGFSVEDCNNRVTVGGQPCVLQPSSTNSTSLICNVDPNNVLEPGVVLPIELTVNNLGAAIVQVDGFTLKPWISSVSPNVGSTTGGQLVTITGGGFKGRLSVQLGQSQCVVDVSLSSYSTVVCRTSAGSASVVVAGVTVTNSQGAHVEAVKLCADGCQYNFSLALKPIVTGVSPTQVQNSSTDLVITGSGFVDLLATVTVGTQTCTDVVVVSDTTITCTVGAVPAGQATITVSFDNLGVADGTPSISSPVVIYSVIPNVGSTNGGTTIVIAGNGFGSASTTTVDIGGAPCRIDTVQPGAITCVTPSHAAASNVAVSVRSGGFAYPTKYFSYASSATPTITSISPSSGLSGTAVTLQGTQLSSTSVVRFGSTACTVSASGSSATQISCTAASGPSGIYSISVLVPGLGYASISPATLRFTYSMAITDVQPSQGSYAGGQEITVTGSGFDAITTTVTICGTLCQKTVVTSTSYQCLTPANTGTSATTSCSVEASSNGLTVTASSQYTYSASLTARITGIQPKMGGTAGGTTLTISGSGFQQTTGDPVVVKVAGVVCEQSTSPTDNVIFCVTGPHVGTVIAPVEVYINSNGRAQPSSTGVADFWYVDRWSSPYTWGGESPPVEGDLVVIPPSMTILLDTDTPVLKMLIIQGKLMFDEQDIELQAENILITDGGQLEVGTEAKPFRHKAIITLWGHLRSPELPVFGAKTLGVRNGTLDLHGLPRITWTVLARTANAGENTITLSIPVDWQVGDHIVIATTGDPVSQFQNEEHVIASVSDDKKTIGLVDALRYRHLGETIQYCNGEVIEMRAEVGLLTRNVVVRGSVNVQWSDTIPACAAGFDPGEFATQTCFLGRFGEDIGSDGFGVSIMMAAPMMDQHVVTHRLSYIEVTHAGQEFRLGRYPIHLHMNGDMSDSYVRGCSIHHTFNRAMNIHNTHNTLFEYNVIYHVEGGAVFLEDSIEYGNVLQYNLAVHVIPSSSLLNDDVTPAAFWATYPNNTIRHNHAAGGSHFGFWYRMLDHPNGPSFDPNICPKKVPLGIFYNNTAHSFGWFGLWTFDEYYPSGTGKCTDTIPTPAVFEKMTAYHCTKGAEFVDAGSLQFKSFLMVNNKQAGIEGKRNFVPIAYQYDAREGPLITDSTIVGCDIYSPTCSQRGIILPYSNGMRVRDTTFINFNSGSSSALGITTMDGVCIHLCGGFTYKFSGIRWCDVSCKAFYRWEHEASFVDEDGSISSVIGSKTVPTNPTLNPRQCASAPEFSCGAVPGVTCSVPWNFHRMAFNNALPLSLFGKTVNMTTEHGSTDLLFRSKDLTHKKGWFCMLQGGCQVTELSFENANFITNITFLAGYWRLDNDDCAIIKITFLQTPDFFQILDGDTRNASDCPLTYEKNYNGDWCFDANSLILYYMVSNKDKVSKRSAELTTTAVDRSTRLHVYQCYFENCIPPNTGPPQNASCARPATAKYWSQASTWPNGRPSAGDDLVIPSDMWLVLDISNPPPLHNITIYGTLELEYLPVAGSYLNIQLNATYIIIQGGHFIAGCPNQPIRGQVTINLVGDHSTREIVTPNGGPVIGAKAIGAFGGLDLHGLNRSVTWTRLQETANAGDSTIRLRESVDWVAGDTIVIATSAFSMQQNEDATVTAVSADGKTLTLGAPLKFNHLGVTRNYGKYDVDYAAEVGLLTRNLRIVGASYPSMQAEAFGARIIVGTFFDGVQVWQGYARIENVEFYHTGQDGFVADYDARFSVTYLDTGAVTAQFPSYCRRNTFHDGFNTAIGAFGSTNGLVIEQNVIFRTVGAGIVITASEIVVDHNLVMSSMFSGTYNGRNEAGNTLLMGSIEVFKGENITLTGNAVAGSERSGYRIKGIPVGSSLVWEKNVAHGILLGVDIMPESIGTDPETWITGFTIYKAWYFGIYSQCGFNTKVSNVVLAENSLGLMLFVIFPSILEHNTEPRWAKFEDSLVVGRDKDVFGCSDSANLTDPSIVTSGTLESWKTDAGGRVGMSFTSFMSGSNMAPGKPVRKIMTYNGLYGKMTVSGVTFANFDTLCDGTCDTVITPSFGNDDGQHPVYMSNLTMINVAHSCLVFYFRPNIALINSADCVDMDCDGKKKNLIKDMDGSFLGTTGSSVIPQAQFEWNGDPRRGLGDYRIPKTLLTDLNGNRIPVDQIVPYKGIVGNRECTFVNEWLAYECSAGRDYEMLIIESMDPDTETRRLSPVAIMADQYIDLVNGPQDHGWCHGYTCRKRVSTFMALVSNGDHHAIYFSSTSPQKLRLHYINTADTQCITTEVYYSVANRIDIYVNDVYVPPLNSYQSGGTLKYNSPSAQCMSCPNAGCSNCPSVSSPTGSNFQNRWSQLVYTTICGSTPVEIRVTDLVLVSFEFPAMTVDDFFGANLVRNLAAFLGVPAGKVRIVNIVSEASGSSSGRRRRAITPGSIVMQVEIGDAAPVASLNNTDASPMNYTQLLTAYQQITDAIQTGLLAGQLNVTFTKVFLAAPLPNANSSDWANVAAALDPTASSSSGAAAVAVLIPARLALITEPPSTGAMPGIALPTQPALQLLTSDGQLVTTFGSILWTVTSTLACTAGSAATLSGTTTVNITQGWANFTDLTVMAADPACTLTFCVSNPSTYCATMRSTSSSFSVVTPTSAISTTTVATGAASTTTGAQRGPLTDSVTLPVWAIAVIVVGVAVAAAAVTAVAVVLAKKAALAQKVGAHEVAGAEVYGSYGAVVDSPPAVTSMPAAEVN